MSVDHEDDDVTHTDRSDRDGELITGPEVLEQVAFAMKVTAELNSLVTNDFAEIRAIFGKLVGSSVDDTFVLIPPFHTNCGRNISIGRNVFVNYGCSFDGMGGITIGDDVMIGPRVNLVTSGHPLDPVERRHGITHGPITIKRNVWIGTGATILPGVTIGENSVVAAGAVVSRDVRPNCVVAGVPATVKKRLQQP
jgi:acetyltransferase-like isoleucine patch superfamily enzyme